VEMRLAVYLEWWRRKRAGLESDSLYLKDWHLANEFPHHAVRSCSAAATRL
jgi:hypothetical protein